MDMSAGSPDGFTLYPQINEVRDIKPTWNAGLVIASIAVSLLGAFTSTQLMCQARVSRATFATTIWTLLASLTFGFCSIWSLHFVAMLACELDVPIGLNVPLTVMSAILAVTFTFLALASDTIWETYKRRGRGRGHSRGRTRKQYKTHSNSASTALLSRESTELLLGSDHDEDEDLERHGKTPRGSPFKAWPNYHEMNGDRHLPEENSTPVSPYTHAPENNVPDLSLDPPDHTTSFSPVRRAVQSACDPQKYLRPSLDPNGSDTESVDRSSTSDSRRSSGFSGSDISSGLGQFISFRTAHNKAIAGRSLLGGTALLLWLGLTRRNLTKGFIWSLAITMMHYLGILSMQIPDGHFVLSPALVLLSACIAAVVCCVGCILMASMETNISQQLLFSGVASTGVAAMHYTGMAATTFYTIRPPFKARGYPASLPIAIASIAIVTCLAANGLLAHSATIARNKLAEIVRTRRKLWAAIAQKENAEAAAIARSEFIASASHEIRTPLHQLQGYSDLMARCPLPEDARLLLFAIQDATKTLSLITNNVLDWSRLEKGEAAYRPAKLDIRAACDSIVKLLPRRDDDLDVELLVVVSPEVPQFLLMDETYLHRISMNLVSNALKFTTSGYILLLLKLHNDSLVIQVEDTGVGIPRSFLPELFEPFKQAQTRGAERGTGLGLSIVKQLLEKVNGDIQTDSKHRDAEGIGAAHCGTQFVVHIPLESSDVLAVLGSTRNMEPRVSLAFFGIANARVVHGMRMAWELFGVDMTTPKDISDLTDETKYACVDLKLFQQDDSLRHALSNRSNLTVLVPYDTENLLFTVLGSVPPTNFVPIKRPWLFHNVVESMLNARLRPSKVDLPRTVRFASEVNIMSASTSGHSSESASELTSQSSSPDLARGHKFESVSDAVVQILLVEDNKINQKLGAKMLKLLGYEVLLAADGQEGIDVLLAHQKTVAIILMDQSMPIKDGLTATKEIRAMEDSSAILGADRWANNEKRRNRRPIIAVTAVVGPTHEAMCQAVGTDAFLPKPLSLNKLRETLDEYLHEDIR